MCLRPLLKRLNSLTLIFWNSATNIPSKLDNQTLILHNKMDWQNNLIGKFLNPCVPSFKTPIPAHKSQVSPYELFKGRNLPLEFFKPIGIRVSYLILPERHHAKLESKGLLGTLVGFNDELRSYQILADESQFVNTCHVKFLDFINNKRENTIDDSDLIILADDEIESPPEENSSASINNIDNNSESPDSEEGIYSSLVPDVPR
ncbi:hypothetical protein VP01_6959g1, partial [Puccinia sorghi]